MEINDEELDAFINLYKSEFDVVLERTEASEKAKLVLWYALFCMRPLAKDYKNGINDMPNVSN